MTAAKPKPRFIVSKRFESGHRCGVVFGPDDWRRTIRLTGIWWRQRWCTWDERQLFLHEVWLVLKRYKHGREWAEFMASMVKKKQ